MFQIAILFWWQFYPCDIEIPFNHKKSLAVLGRRSIALMPACDTAVQYTPVSTIYILVYHNKDRVQSGSSIHDGTLELNFRDSIIVLILKLTFDVHPDFLLCVRCVLGKFALTS